ncbi:MAG: type II toxin-antitoxin system PrlF family antitoxin [Betaproteobacteria bacterium]|nr:type II toxin-antitoxin system PrlF family antitoxin [Betaproteobacteria bacterium]
MPATIELESTLTDRYQTTVPDGVRRALKLGKRDRIRYLVQSDGAVILQRAEQADDPVLGTFLDLLAHDIATQPQKVRTIDSGLARRMRALTKGVKVDLEASLDPADE